MNEETHRVADEHTIIDKVIRHACWSVAWRVQHTAHEVAEVEGLIVLPQDVELRAVGLEVLDVEHVGHDGLYGCDVGANADRGVVLLLEQHCARHVVCSSSQSTRGVRRESGRQTGSKQRRGETDQRGHGSRGCT